MADQASADPWIGKFVVVRCSAAGVHAGKLVSIYREAYAAEPFVRVVDTPPSTKAVTGTNRADVFVTYDDHVEALVAICVIDNLGKGAAGQAVQNLNLMAGLPEPTGIPIDAVWP